MSVVYKFRQACIFRDFSESGATLEDLARAWASIEGNRDEFSMPPNEKANTSPQFV